MKNGDIENTKLDFRGWFYKFVVKIGYFFIKITKRSSEFAILVKKYEICDFGGSFGNFYQFFLVKWDRIVSEIWSKNAEKLPKDPRKMRNEFSIV
jgi:hypothetical protein